MTTTLQASDYLVLDALKAKAGSNQKFLINGLDEICEAVKQPVVSVGFSVVRLMFLDFIRFEHRGSDKSKMVVTLLAKAKGGTK